MSNPFMTNVQVLARAELALAGSRGRLATKRLALVAASIVFGLLGLGLLNVAAFLAMSPSRGPAGAALLVALIDLGIMVAALVIAGLLRPNENEEKLAREMRDLASSEIDRDIEQVKSELAELSESVRSIHTCFRSLSEAATRTLTPLMGLLLRPGKKG